MSSTGGPYPCPNPCSPPPPPCGGWQPGQPVLHGPAQYVGARYVPKFADPVEWNLESAYEPLTIVTFQGSTYTSKMAVPKNTSINDTQYWAKTADYNAQTSALAEQVTQYQTQVTELSGTVSDNIKAQDTVNKTLQNEIQSNVTAINNINPLYNKRIHIFGDSISDSNVYKNNWVTLLKNNNPNTTILNHANTGATIAATSTNSTYYQVYNQSTDNNANYVIWFAGINDYLQLVNPGNWSSDITTFAGSLKATSNLIISKFPNAVVIVIAPLDISSSYVRKQVKELPLMHYRLLESVNANNNGFIFASGGAAPKLRTSTASNWLVDGLHPTDAYYVYFEKWISGILANKTNIENPLEVKTFTANTQSADFLTVTIREDWNTPTLLVEFTSDGNALMDLYSTTQTSIKFDNSLLATFPEFWKPTINVPAITSTGSNFSGWGLYSDSKLNITTNNSVSSIRVYFRFKLNILK